MIGAILTFVVELFFLILARVRGDKFSSGGAVLIILIFAICLMIAIICIVHNAKNIRDYAVSKGICVTGLVFSIVATAIPAIFFLAMLFGIVAGIK